MNQPIEEHQRPDEESLKQMRERGGTWAAYENKEIGHPKGGHMQFLKFGPDCTLERPPERLPYTNTQINWRYWLVGVVNLQTGLIEEYNSPTETA
jgi:hypothetical protein